MDMDVFSRPARRFRLSTAVHTVTSTIVDQEPLCLAQFSELAAKFSRIRARSFRRICSQGKERPNMAYNKALDWLNGKEADDTSSGSPVESSDDSSLEEGRRADSVIDNQISDRYQNDPEKILLTSPVPDVQIEEDKEDEEQDDDVIDDLSRIADEAADTHELDSEAESEDKEEDEHPSPAKKKRVRTEKENWSPDPAFEHLMERTIVQEPARRYPQRKRVQPMEFWRNQRVKYGRDSTGTCFKVVGVDDGFPGYDPLPKSRLKGKKKTGSQAGRGKETSRRINLMDLSIHAHHVDPAKLNNNKFVRKLQKGKHLVSSLKDVHFNPSSVSPDVEIALTHKVGTFSRGMLKFKPFATKTRQQTVVPTTIFAVLHGVVAVKVNDEEAVVLKTGGSLELQNETYYSIENLRSDEAVLTFNILRSE